MFPRPAKSKLKNIADISSKSDEFALLTSLELGQWLVKQSPQGLSDSFEQLKTQKNFQNSLNDLPEATLSEIFKNLEDEDLVRIINDAKLDDATSFLEVLGEDRQEELVDQLKRKAKIKLYLTYPKDSCGRSMETDFFTLPIELTAAQALDHIRNNAGESQLFYLYCQTTTGKLIGVVSLKELATSPKECPLDELVRRDVLFVEPKQDIGEAVKIVKRADLVALPVLNERMRLLGIISIDDLLDEVEEQATAEIYKNAGLQEMDSVTMKAHLSYMSRAPWVVLNLFLAVLGSAVIAVYEPTIARLPILAALMPIAAGLGGNTAIQSLTIVTRGLAIGDFDYISYTKATLKEISVGVALGATAALVALLIVYTWKKAFFIGSVLGLSIVINSFVAAVLGTLVPIVMKTLNKDPAVGSGVLVTTLSDLFCFFSFLTLANLFL